jgi:hypothetical protein
MKIPGFESAAGMTKSVATSSALNPILTLSAICSPIALAIAAFSGQWDNPLLTGLALGPPAIAIFQILLFTFIDRDRLQSERHIETKMVLNQMNNQIGDKSGTVTIQDQKSINNPSLEGIGDV